MSLQFILGGGRSGKSSLLYNQIIEHSLANKNEKILLLVPEQYTLKAQRHIVEKHPNHGVMNVDILSFERLARKVFDELGINAMELLDDTGKTMMLRRILSEHRDELYTFKGYIHKKGFVIQLKSMLSELMQYGISPQKLKEKNAELGASPVLYGKIQDIYTIYRIFLDEIKEKYVTSEEIPDRLLKVIEGSDYVRNAYIYMDNFTGFTPIQYRLMEKILGMTSKVVIALTVDTEALFFKSIRKEELFKLTMDTIRQLDGICADNSICRERDIIVKNSSPKKCDFKAFILPEPRSEMRYVAMQIHELIVHHGYRYKDIAVVSGDINKYNVSAKYWFDLCGIPCFFDERKNISNNMLSLWVKSFLGMFIKNFSYEAVFSYLRCGLSGVECEKVDRLENYVLATGIRGISRWENQWIVRTAGMSEDELIELNSIREDFINPILETVGLFAKADFTFSDILKTIYSHMECIGIKEQLQVWKERFEEDGDLSRAREYDQIYDVVIALLEKIYLILGNEKATPRGFLDVYEAGISDIKVGIIPPGLDQVTFADIRRSRLDDVKVLFFVGMNDGIVPFTGNSAGLITDFERVRLADHDIRLAPTASEDACTELFYLYTVLSKPSDKLIMSCSAQDTNGKELRVSSLVTDICRAMPMLELKNINMDELEPGQFDVFSGYQYMIKGLREYALSGKASDNWLELYTWFGESKHYNEKTDILKEAAFYRHNDEKLSKLAIQALYNGKLSGGVTMLEKYAACEYAHFLSYGLRLKERDIYQVQAPDIGMIFHQAIEMFSLRLNRNENYSWYDIPDDERNRWIDECVRSVSAKYNHEIMKDSNRAKYLTEKIMRMARRTIWALQQQLKKGDFEPVGYEMNFTTDLNTESTYISYGDDGELALRGKIDRMDICDDEDNRYIKIVDYKSGGTKFDLSAVYYGLQMQLVVYMNAAREVEAGRVRKDSVGKVVIPAGILYYHIDDPVIQVKEFSNFVCEDTDDKTTYDNDILEQLVPTGLIVEDEKIINHLDRNVREAPKVLPLTYMKNKNQLTQASSTAVIENFNGLSMHVKEMTQKLGRDILSGEISVNPYKYGTKNACEYCSYRGICGFDAGNSGYNYRYMRKLSKKQVWEEITKEAGKWGANGQMNSLQ